MTPIFKNTDVSLKNIGEFMQNYTKEHSVKDVLRRLLIGSYLVRKLDCPGHFYNSISIKGLSSHIFTLSSNSYLMLLSAVSLCKPHKQDWMENAIKTKH